MNVRRDLHMNGLQVDANRAKEGNHAEAGKNAGSGRDGGLAEGGKYLLGGCEVEYERDNKKRVSERGAYVEK